MSKPLFLGFGLQGRPKVVAVDFVRLDHFQSTREDANNMVQVQNIGNTIGSKHG